MCWQMSGNVTSGTSELSWQKECLFFVCIGTKCHHVSYFFITLYRTHCLSCTSCTIFVVKPNWPMVNCGSKHSWSNKSSIMFYWSLWILVLEPWDAKVYGCSCSYCVITKDQQIGKGILINDLNYFYSTCEA